MLKLIKNKIERSKQTTVRKLISSWAPPSDGNDTEAYISFVESALREWGINPDSLVADGVTVRAIGYAIAEQENGSDEALTVTQAEIAWSLV